MWNRQQFLVLSGAMALSVLGGTAGAADGLVPPRGRVVLTVTGAISLTNAPGLLGRAERPPVQFPEPVGRAL